LADVLRRSDRIHRQSACLRELIRLSESDVYWQRQAMRHHRINFEADGRPESWSDVSLFRCLHCSKNYWVFQFT
jgi:hypothetical protein